jgi:hypothetical protein
VDWLGGIIDLVDYLGGTMAPYIIIVGLVELFIKCIGPLC